MLAASACAAAYHSTCAASDQVWRVARVTHGRGLSSHSRGAALSEISVCSAGRYMFYYDMSVILTVLCIV